jgi:hypothetical protein
MARDGWNLQTEAVYLDTIILAVAISAGAVTSKLRIGFAIDPDAWARSQAVSRQPGGLMVLPVGRSPKKFVLCRNNYFSPS